MFSHLFKMIWNKKKQNSLLIVEILLSFMVLFGVFAFGVNAYQNYMKPMGIDYEHVWVINYNNTLKTTNADSLKDFYQGLLKNIKAMPQVVNATYTSNNVPFSTSHMGTGISMNGKQFSNINTYNVGDEYPQTLGLKVLEGRWFNVNDAATNQRIIIINKALKEKIFGNGKAVGQFIKDYDGKNKIKIIGVTDDGKYEGTYQTAQRAMYNRIDTATYHWLGNIMVKVTPDADAAFEARLNKLMANALKNSNIEIEHLSNKLVSANKLTIVPLIIVSVIAAFLIINVALGIFGVLWYNINKRRGEIGLRRAVGAPGQSVAVQLVIEAMLIATLSIIIGTFFAVQFPLLNVFDLSASVYLTAILLAILFIYVLVLMCSFYPGKQAAAIYPAVALHEE